jgi:uncharacterized coiled-coil DUF342 family protein
MPHQGNLLDDLQELADYRHDDHSVAEDAIEVIKKLRSELGKIKNELCNAKNELILETETKKVFGRAAKGFERECEKLHVEIVELKNRLGAEELAHGETILELGTAKGEIEKIRAKVAGLKAELVKYKAMFAGGEWSDEGEDIPPLF